jgi:6-phosphogluconolactonase
VSETRTALIALSFDDATGRMEILEETPVLAGGETEGASGADIQAHPSGQFLYASMRGRAGIAICRMDGARGSLEAASFVPLPGGALDELRIVPGGEFLLAPTDKGILSYRIATGTGALARSGGSRGIPSGAIALLGARQSGSGQEGEAK